MRYLLKRSQKTDICQFPGLGLRKWMNSEQKYLYIGVRVRRNLTPPGFLPTTKLQCNSDVSRRQDSKSLSAVDSYPQRQEVLLYI